MNQITARSFRKSIPAMAIVVMCVVGCTTERDKKPERSHQRPLVVVTNYPLEYFADRITDGGCEIVYPVPRGTSPDSWKPDEAAVRKIREADRILTNGPIPVAWVQAADPLSDQIVNTTEVFERSLLRTDATAATAVDPNSSAPIDRFTWLNPKLANHQAETCLETLARLDPPNAAAYQESFEKLRRDLVEMDSRLTAITDEYADEPLLAPAPVFNYLTQRCGLNLKSLDWPLDKMPDEAKWNRLKAILKGHPAKWMLWPSEPNPKVAKRLKSLGIETVVFDPCDTPPSTGNFLDTMDRNYRHLEELFVSLAATPVRAKRTRLPTDLRTPELPKNRSTLPPPVLPQRSTPARGESTAPASTP